MRASLHRLPSRLSRLFVRHFGSLLLYLGLTLVALGGLIWGVRQIYLVQMAQQIEMPDFEDSLDLPTPQALAAGPETLASPSPPPTLAPQHIEIPSVKIDTDIVEVGWESRIINGEHTGNVWKTADYAAGLHAGSAGLDQPGNTVISGHNNIAGSVFAELHAVEKGDLVFLGAGETRRVYKVDSKFVLWEEGASDERRRVNAKWIEPTPDERVTLVSCYPPWGNTHRVIVVARPVEDEMLPDLSAGAAVR
jgi:LPXTG-site transpeptidase (sortase) family protein